MKATRNLFIVSSPIVFFKKIYVTDFNERPLTCQEQSPAPARGSPVKDLWFWLPSKRRSMTANPALSGVSPRARSVSSMYPNRRVKRSLAWRNASSEEIPKCRPRLPMVNRRSPSSAAACLFGSVRHGGFQLAQFLPHRFHYGGRSVPVKARPSHAFRDPVGAHERRQRGGHRSRSAIGAFPRA